MSEQKIVIDPHLFKGVELEKYAELYQCCVCTMLLRDAIELSCGHLFCQQCIETWLDKKPECAFCRAPIRKVKVKRKAHDGLELPDSSNEYKWELHPAKFIRRQIADLKLSCIHKSQGCAWEGQLGVKQDGLQNHLDHFCEHHPIACRFHDNHPKLIRSLQREHEKCCPDRFVPCDLCKEDVRLSFMCEHRDIYCREEKLECSQKCGDWIARKNIYEHKLVFCAETEIRCRFNLEHPELKRKFQMEHEKVCECRPIECLLCKDVFEFNHLDYHTQNECSERKLNCPNSCGKSMAQKDLAMHLSNHCSESFIVCPFFKCGCSHQCLRREMKEHEIQFMDTHRDQMLSLMSLLRNGQMSSSSSSSNNNDIGQGMQNIAPAGSTAGVIRVGDGYRLFPVKRPSYWYNQSPLGSWKHELCVGDLVDAQFFGNSIRGFVHRFFYPAVVLHFVQESERPRRLSRVYLQILGLEADPFWRNLANVEENSHIVPPFTKFNEQLESGDFFRAHIGVLTYISSVNLVRCNFSNFLSFPRLEMARIFNSLEVPEQDEERSEGEEEAIEEL